MEQTQIQTATISHKKLKLKYLNGLAYKRKHTYREVKARTSQYYFDRAMAARAVRFFETECFHYEGEFAGQPFKLERWQRRIVQRIFGWMHKYGEQAGTRVVREVYLEVPRKNGKSYFCSALAAYLFFADKEMGAQVISAAADTAQAGIVYRGVKEIVFQNPKLSKLVGEPYRASMGIRKTASSFKVLSSKPNTKHGLNLHGGIVDELHAHQNRELVDVLLTSTSSRRQPLMIYITTAGTDRQSICYEKHEYAMGIINGDFEDDSFYGIIFGTEEGDDWTDPETWYKANPNLGVSKKLAYFEKEIKKAQKSAQYENTFKQLELNIWTEQSIRWIPMARWDSCDREIELESLKGQECFGGLDLSSTTDLTAFAAIFPKDTGVNEWVEENGELVQRRIMEVDVLMKYWVPEDNLAERTKAEERRFRKWIAEGFLTATPGAVVDYDRIRHFILEFNRLYNLREVAIDRWNGTQLSTQLDGDGITVIPWGQGYASMSAPAKTLHELVLAKRIAHGADPVLRWNAGNVAIEKDAAGNIKPSKKKSLQKIDGIIAVVNALGRVISWKDDSSIYGERGIISLG